MVVVHHRLAVGDDLQVGLNRVVAGQRGLEGGRGVLDHAFRGIMQAAVGNRPGGKPVGHGAPAPQLTSKAPSTSTAASSGSADTPTVVRAWRPLSPNAVTMRSEAPFITLGPSVKPAAELMKPPSRTTRATLSRSPSALLSCASRLTAQACAALVPCSIETPPPSWPLATTFPSASRQSWPEMMSSLPVRTNGT